MKKQQALNIVRDYYNSWTNKDFERAGNYLSKNLKVIVPINNYPTKQSFLDAVKFTCNMILKIELLSEFSNENEAILMYDMSLNGMGKLRIAEYFKIKGNKIIQVCQIHDTAPIRNYNSTVDGISITNK
ncbi:MAG TPA: hypothetical protein VFI29_19590 [Hanamia sp.]|nr:hypothetical protein [Hanamia sp.]